MDLLHLEHFLAVAEEGSFTRAAERVYRTQPAVSQSIKKLEDDIGVPLFARDMPELHPDARPATHWSTMRGGC